MKINFESKISEPPDYLYSDLNKVLHNPIFSIPNNMDIPKDYDFIRSRSGGVAQKGSRP